MLKPDSVLNDKRNQSLLNAIAGLEKIPAAGAVNIRSNGEVALRRSSPNVKLSSLPDKPGLLVDVKAGAKGETVYVPVVLTADGMHDKVYNTFLVNEDAEVLIVAGCGIHNTCSEQAQHDGIHEIIVKKGGKLRYVEKHYGEGKGDGRRVLNPTTVIRLEAGAAAELEMVQIKGVDDTIRDTVAYLGDKASLKITERLLTEGCQNAESIVNIYLEGKDSSAQVLSRSVAQDTSAQIFRAALIGKNTCMGHVECDAILMDQARIKSVPEIAAEDAGAVLTHEAAIGRIAGEQLIKLMTLGLTEQEAINAILEGFLK
ncbi:MAG: SufD family Fe-S cluster assembly protein [Syntrophomonadaceae bacterium]|nr:SufD family Fe-S cluster assembly protein [Syntrophomonadaceae bacterium]